MKKYLIEFLLLFLAIFLSFQAENLREYLKRLDEEKTNLREIVKNLNADITALDLAIQYNENQLKQADTVFRILSATDEFNAQKLARNAIQLITLRHFSPVQSTYNNIIYSGKLDIIRNPDIISGLNDYYELIEYNQNTTEAVMQFHSRRTLTTSLKNALVDQNLIEDFLGYHFPVGTIQLDELAKNKDLISSLLIKKQFIQIQLNVFRKIRQAAIDLRDKINEYNLK